METKITKKDQNKGSKIKENQNYNLSIKKSRAQNKKKSAGTKRCKHKPYQVIKGNVGTPKFTRWKT